MFKFDKENSDFIESKKLVSDLRQKQSFKKKLLQKI